MNDEAGKNVVGQRENIFRFIQSGASYNSNSIIEIAASEGLEKCWLGQAMAKWCIKKLFFFICAISIKEEPFDLVLFDATKKSALLFIAAAFSPTLISIPYSKRTFFLFRWHRCSFKCCGKLIMNVKWGNASSYTDAKHNERTFLSSKWIIRNTFFPTLFDVQFNSYRFPAGTTF